MSVDYAIRCNGCAHVSSDTEPVRGTASNSLEILRARLRELGWRRLTLRAGMKSVDLCPRCADAEKEL